MTGPGDSSPAARTARCGPAWISVVGASGAGKTLLTERLTPALLRRGLAVAAVKATGHGFQLDREGSDSWRLARAGADPVVVVGFEQLALVVSLAGSAVASRTAPRSEQHHVSRHVPVEERLRAAVQVVGGCRGVDVVLVEGLTDAGLPAVLVHRSGIPLREPGDRNTVLAAVTDEPLGYKREISPDNAEAVADLVIAHLGEMRGSEDACQRVVLHVDGALVQLSPFAGSFLAGGVLGMVASLKDVPAQPSRVELLLEW